MGRGVEGITHERQLRALEVAKILSDVDAEEALATLKYVKRGYRLYLGRREWPAACYVVVVAISVIAVAIFELGEALSVAIH